jgi:hypothetical protein
LIRHVLSDCAVKNCTVGWQGWKAIAGIVKSYKRASFGGMRRGGEVVDFTEGFCKLQLVSLLPLERYYTGTANNFAMQITYSEPQAWRWPFLLHPTHPVLLAFSSLRRWI